MKLKPSEIAPRLALLIKHRKPFLLTGSPGVGKTDLGVQGAAESGAECIISHPVVSDPTDYKGVPAIVDRNGQPAAKFLPFGELWRLIEADKPTLYIADDVGQAPPSVQAALMQLFLNRAVNEHKISDMVTLAACTNRRSDKAGVTGIISALLNRFDQVYEVVFDVDDWVGWALRNGMPESLVAFARWRPGLISDFKPPKDDLSPCATPRSVAKLGGLINIGMDDYATYESGCGEGFATEFEAFNRTRKDIPDMAALIRNPDSVGVPTRPDVLYATAGALAYRATAANFAPIMRYTERLPVEFQTVVVKDSITKNRALSNTQPFNDWAVRHQDTMLG